MKLIGCWIWDSFTIFDVSCSCFQDLGKICYFLPHFPKRSNGWQRVSLILPRSSKLDLLKNYPQFIPTLAQWLYEEWHPYDASLTKEDLIQALKHRLNDAALPMTFVVLKESLPMGTVTLKKEKAPEFSDFPQDSVWMGSLQVVPEERSRGIGQELFKFSQTIAKQLGYEKLYFFTSNPKNVRWYLERGAQVIEERPFRQHRTTLMEVKV